MAQKLFNFLTNKTCDKDEATHVSMITPKRNYRIMTPEDKETFRTLYCNCVAKKDGVLGIAEKPRPIDYTVLRVDLDFKLDPSKYSLDDDPVDLQMIERIITFYQAAIKEVCVDDDSFEEDMQNCILLLKKNRYRLEDGVIKTGFHLHFPFFISNKFIQDNVIRNKVIQSCSRTRIFSDIHTSTGKISDSDLAKIVDPIASKTWLMYGSRKYPEADTWDLVSCYDSNLQKIELKDIFQNEMVLLKQNTKTTISKVRYHLPIFLSIFGYGYSKANIKPFILDSQRKTKVKTRGVKKRRSEQDVLEDLKLIENGGLMQMLSEERAVNYNSWIEVGWVLYCISDGHQKGFDLWDEFSSKSSLNYDYEVCVREWNKMVNKGMTMGTLRMMANADSPVEYSKWREMYIKNDLDEAVRTACEKSSYTSVHIPMAKLIYSCYKDKFSCADFKKDLWFSFYNHKWNQIDGICELKKEVINDLTRRFLEYKIENTKLCTNADSESDDYDRLISKDKKINRILAALRNDSYIDKIINASKTFFHDKNFLNKINEKRNLLGCENGVYDLEIGLFREGRPDDYITFSTKIDYINFNNRDRNVIELNDFLDKIFPNENLKYYFLHSAAACLRGGNDDKRFIIYTGDNGDNGKSCTVKLLELVFGEYAWKFEQELILKGMGNSSATARPEIMQSRGRRIAFVDEIAKSASVDIGVVKKLTGNDSWFARGLYTSGGVFTPMFTLILQCNELPSIPAHDNALWNRIRVLLFDSVFSDNAPESEEEQKREKIFKKDIRFAENLPNMAEPMLWLLTQIFKEYNKNGITEPTEVTVSTNTYKSNNDVYAQYFTAKIKKDDGGVVELPDLTNNFKIWYEEEYPDYASKDKSKTTKREVLKKFSGKKLLGAPTNKSKTKPVWKGWMIAEEDEEDE